MPLEGPKPHNCCRSNTDGTKACWRYYVCHVPFGCDPSYLHLEVGVALIYQGITEDDPPLNRWHWRHTDVIPAIFRQATFTKTRVDLGGFWRGEVRAALLSGLHKDKLVNRFAPVQPLEFFSFPLVPLFGPEDPDFLPQGMTFTGFNRRTAILADFPDCDLRMLPV